MWRFRSSSSRVGARGSGPRPDWIFAAARSHTFAQLATAIDDAFGRWDRAHLMQFELADGTRLERPDWDEESEGDDARKSASPG